MKKYFLFLFFVLIFVLASVPVFAGFDVCYSDITAYINHYPIPSFATGGKTVIRAEDLSNFGFDVRFDSEKMTLFVNRNDEIFIKGMSFKKDRCPTGYLRGRGLKNSVKVVVCGKEIPSFAFDGCSMIAMEDLTHLGNVYWVPHQRAVKIWIDGIHITDYEKVDLGDAVIDVNKPMIALTFDDGPGEYTDDIVKILKENDARATFFVVGSRVPSYTYALNLAYLNGMEIGNHSFSHSDLSKLDRTTLKQQIGYTNDRIESVIGCASKIMRPPGGFVSDMFYKNIGMPVILWSVDTKDWESRNADKVAKQILSAKDGDIVLMHDLYESTLKAVEKTIPELKKRGYQLVTVSELAYFKGVSLNPGRVYRKFN